MASWEPKQDGQSAGLQEHDPTAGTDVTVGHGSGQSGQSPAGVDGIQE